MPPILSIQSTLQHTLISALTPSPPPPHPCSNMSNMPSILFIPPPLSHYLVTCRLGQDIEADETRSNTLYTLL